MSEPLAQPGFTPTHPYAMLLPWYVTGRLGDQEEQEVAEHLAGCVSCRLELDQLTAMRGGLIAAYADQPGPSPKVREQVMAETRQAESESDSSRQREAAPVTRQTGAIERWSRGLFAPRWLPALAVTLIVGQLGLLLWTMTGRQTDRTNGESIMTRSISPSPIRLKVAFHETAPEHRIREALRALRGRIVDGPSPDGMYVIEITETDSSGLSERMTIVERQPDVIRTIERVTP
ncbi:MAG: anti-sigma factor family protein [Nitrospiraceae bacterium]